MITKIVKWFEEYEHEIIEACAFGFAICLAFALITLSFVI